MSRLLFLVVVFVVINGGLSGRCIDNVCPSAGVACSVCSNRAGTCREGCIFAAEVILIVNLSANRGHLVPVTRFNGRKEIVGYFALSVWIVACCWFLVIFARLLLLLWLVDLIILAVRRDECQGTASTSAGDRHRGSASKRGGNYWIRLILNGGSCCSLGLLVTRKTRSLCNLPFVHRSEGLHQLVFATSELDHHFVDVVCLFRHNSVHQRLDFGAIFGSSFHFGIGAATRPVCVQRVARDGCSRE
mmetsp:Transcript_9848/g.27865  ORF Transcript_9848/g.27865 Transcript_9848/m.27865 type:complete len:246 (-) Transcript_9848:2915-3652(-)